jgi:glutamate N-acetyltransferase / amino-acid N-acetyltransferase
MSPLHPKMTDPSSFLIPRGFRFGAAKAGLKASGRPDFALIVAEAPAAAAAFFTANRVTAAPIQVDKEHLGATAGLVRVAAINAGNANCAAGQAGLDAARATCAAVARHFHCRPEEVFPSSTGIIGVPLPAEKLIAALPDLAADLGSGSHHFLQAAQAILTTDTVEKTAFAHIDLASASAHGLTPAGAPAEVRIAGFAKGAGMIHPQLVPHATMLAYVLTDAEIAPPVLAAYLRDAVEVSFNRISVDGDTSTNDTVLLLASGASGASIGPGNSAFAAALTDVCTSLARQMVADGEGVSHVVELRIEGAASDADALRVAAAIARSPLVKTAWTGCDPNWGRIVAAIGASAAPIQGLHGELLAPGVDIDPQRIDISFGDLPVCRNGAPAPEFDEASAHAYITQPEFSISIHLHQGHGRCVFWTTDLTAEYIRINADYST